MDISVVIPLYNEDESIPELYAWIERVMKENNYSYEVIFVNDGSTDRSWEIISELNRKQPLWQESGTLLWIRTGSRRRGDYDGCRPSGLSR